MARVALHQRTGVVRTSGIVFLALILAILWLTHAVFTKRFSDDVPVTVVSERVGLALSKNADVKLRGVIVGRVETIAVDGGAAEIDLRLDPDLAATIPAQVEAFIVPKTLFGEKYVDLRPVSGSGGRAIAAGARIRQGTIPAEVERLLDDAYPLLTAVEPAQLSATLTALSEALDGQGDDLGASLDELEAYLVKLEPLSDELVDDIVALGEVSETYGDAMPEIGDLLADAVVTGDTVVAKEQQITRLFAGVDKLADTADALLDDHGDQLITLADESQATLDLLARYAPTLSCVLNGIKGLMPRLDDAFRDQRAHVSIEFGPRSATGYGAGEDPRYPAVGRAPGPGCRTLPTPPYDADRPAPGAPAEVLALFGIADHRRSMVTALVAGAAGVEPGEIPDLATDLAAPALEGAEVSVR
ncbi:MCE family protein [Nocardioides sp. SLBN-35]|uniref:MCE family protein n=1 Tax=Nocardioides sp. SLBN-35 TaxID=2768445 RepID=UPI00115189E9|nr:MCE family protein [Nocardioides sp. SLBN-35]TQK68781.1 phospholipid/cholesterol/gamma-HCH transport system substrate-binding protein [Nocardioides sp. SLBN-35]